MPTMKKKSFLVTGGTGFIGSGISERLVQSGHKVTIFDNNSRGKISRQSSFDIYQRFPFWFKQFNITSFIKNQFQRFKLQKPCRMTNDLNQSSTGTPISVIRTNRPDFSIYFEIDINSRRFHSLYSLKSLRSWY